METIRHVIDLGGVPVGSSGVQTQRMVDGAAVNVMENQDEGVRNLGEYQAIQADLDALENPKKAAYS